jgi:hypothetical protein
MSFKTVGGDMKGQHGVTADTRRKHAAAMTRAKALPKDEELTKTLEGKIRAKWRIEIIFLKNRSSKEPTPYGCKVWEAGAALNGDGDVGAFWCLDSRPESNEGCRGIIPADCVRGGVAICPHCHKALNADLLTDETGGRVYMDKLAAYLADLFRNRLNSNADIYLKYHREDIRYIAMMKAKGPAAAARFKGLHIYPLDRIMKDISTGADLTRRIKAFLTS